MAKTDLTLRAAQSAPYPHATLDANFQRLMYWSGVWAAGTYEANEVVRHRGEPWVVIAASTTTEPGTVAGAADWQRLSSRVVEVWQVTPIVGMPALGQVLTFTFLPLFTGQVPQLVTHNAGTFTINSPNAASTTLDIRFTVAVTMNISANNQAVEWLINETYSGAGLNTILGMGGSMGSPRADAFPATNISMGSIVAADGETLLWTGSSEGDGTSAVDIAEGFMVIEGPPT
jgi:hypothetical protein